MFLDGISYVVSDVQFFRMWGVAGCLNNRFSNILIGFEGTDWGRCPGFERLPSAVSFLQPRYRSGAKPVVCGLLRDSDPEPLRQARVPHGREGTYPSAS